MDLRPSSPRKRLQPWQRLSDRQQRVYDAHREYREAGLAATAQDLAERLYMAARQVRSVERELAELGLLVPEGKDFRLP